MQSKMYMHIWMQDENATNNENVQRGMDWMDVAEKNVVPERPP